MIERFSSALREQVAEQTRLYERTVDAIKKRSDTLGLPKRGDAIETFSQEHRHAIGSELELNFRSHGFASAAEAKSFLERARVSDVRQRCNFITSVIDEHQQTMLRITEIRVRRTP
ncbi:MAG TPA: hypothetical protein PLH94_10870 [Fimbriimonadaceae bacterium]|nr:hypothetical protein [Fimbriimonadaceae bacterium]